MLFSQSCTGYFRHPVYKGFYKIVHDGNTKKIVDKFLIDIFRVIGFVAFPDSIQFDMLAGGCSYGLGRRPLEREEHARVFSILQRFARTNEFVHATHRVSNNVTECLTCLPYYVTPG